MINRVFGCVLISIEIRKKGKAFFPSAKGKEMLSPQLRKMTLLFLRVNGCSKDIISLLFTVVYVVFYYTY
jgi:hypothetical protein